ncbi:MAG: traK, partial [Proteobacteria bacterium]
MAKNYTDELARWATKRQGKVREKNLVIFHALQDDVRAALDAGFSAKTIWAHMQEQGRVDFGYETFLDYVNRVIKTARSAKSGTRTGEMASST